MSTQLDREKALALLKEYNESESLVNHGLANGGVAMTLIDGRIGAQAIQIAFALHIIHPYPLGAFNHHIQGVVVMGAIGFVEFNIIAAFHRILRLAAGGCAIFWSPQKFCGSTLTLLILPDPTVSYTKLGLTRVGL